MILVNVESSEKMGTKKSMTSEIVAYLGDTVHQMDYEVFKVICNEPGNSSKAVRQLKLATAESIAIRLLNPKLCSYKIFVKSLQPLWARSENTSHVPDRDHSRVTESS